MAQVVSYVKAIRGTVIARTKEGGERVLKLGDAIYANEFVDTGKDGYVELTMGEEAPFIIRQQETVQMAEALNPASEAAESADEAVVALAPSELDSILQQIADGADPSTLLAPTAAGAGGGGGGHSFVRLMRIAETTEGSEPTSVDPVAAIQPINFPATSVDEENQPPVVSDQTVSINEDGTLSGNLNAFDPNGDALTYAVASGPANGTLVINADGSYVYTPNTNFNGNDTFTIQVSDGQGGISSATINVTVNAVNDAPVAQNDAVTTNEDSAVTINVLANDSDVDGDTLTVTAASVNPAQGTVTINADGTLNFVPATNFNGVAVITYTISDGNGGTSTATVNVTVNAVNDAPVAVNDTATTDEDTAVNINVLSNDSDVDGDTLTVTAASVNPAQGTVTINSDGTLNFVPATNFNGVAVISYTISDGNGGTSNATVNVTVNAVNDAPTTSDVALNTNEDTAVNGAIVANDVDGDSLSYALGTGPSNGSVTLNADGTFTYTPNANYNGGDSFTVTVSDGNGGTVTSTVSINVGAVNDVPVAVNDTATTDEDTAVTINVLTNDTDADGDTLTVTSASALNGTVVINSDGSLTYTPNANYNGSDTISYTISDGNGGTSNATVNVTVNAVNDAPTTSDVALNTSEDTAVNGAIVASDVDGDSLSYALGTGPSNGSVTLNADGTFTYTPNANYNGSDSFTVIVSDGNGGTVTSTVSINVGAVNDAPVAVNDAATTDEDTAVTINVLSNDTDADGDTLTVTSASALNGTVVINSDGTLTYTPNANYNGSDTISYTISDGNGGSATATVSVSVNAIADAPVVGGDTAGSVTEDVGVNAGFLNVSGTLTVADPDAGESGTQASTQAGSYGSFTIDGNGNWSYSASNSQNAIQNLGAGNTLTESFTVYTMDGTPQTITVTINGTNDAPTLTGIASTLTYSENTGSSITRTLLDNNVTFADRDSVNFDGGTLTVQINNPVGNQDQLGVTNQGNNTGQISVSGNNILYNFGSGPIVIGSMSGLHTGLLQINFNGNATPQAVDALIQRLNYGNSSQLPDTTPRSVTITITDGDGTANGGSDTVVHNMTINVVSRNDAPSFGGFGGTRGYTEGGAAVVLDNNATINDGELAALGNFGGMTLTINRNTGANAEDQFVGSGTLNLTSGNVVLNGVVVGSYDQAALSNGQLIITFANGTTNAQATSVLRQIAYTNSSDAPPSSVVLNAVLNDGNTGAQGTGGARNSAIGTITINIAPTNDVPVALNDTATTDEDTPVTINVLSNDTDADGDTLTVTAASVNPTQGTVTINADGTLNFAPAVNFNGIAVISYTISDGNGGTSTATVNVTVNPVNDAPVAANDTATTDEDTAVTINVLSNDTDADGDTLTVTAASVNPTEGTVTINADGTLNFVPAADFNGVAVISYTISDGNGGTSNATVNVTVNAVNDAAVIGGTDTGAAQEDVSTSASGTLTISDADGAAEQAFVPQVNSAASYGSFSIDSAGNWVYSLNNSSNAVQSLAAGQVVTDTITVASVDGTTHNIVVTITGSNDAPQVSAATDLGNMNDSGSLLITAAQLLTHASDIDAGTTLTVVGLSLADSSAGSLVDNGNGTWTFTPASGVSGAVSFQYGVSDGLVTTPTSAAVNVVDTTAPSAPTVTIVDDANNDGFINAAELAGNITVQIDLPTDARANDVLNVVINGVNQAITLTTAHITAGLLTLSTANPGEGNTLTVSASITDAAGNVGASATDSAVIDTQVSATITVNNITSDDIVNAAEAAGSIVVSGSVGGDAALGDAVTMQINGVTYGGNVIDIGGGALGYQIAVAGSDLAADTNFDITVSGSDSAGNPFSATVTSTHSVDVTANATITLNAITADNVINAAEAAPGNYITITGSVGGDAEVGDTVVVSVGGNNYTTTVLSGMTFAIDVLGSVLAANNQVSATVSGSDAAGNPFSNSDIQAYTVDTSASATITVNNITSDDIVNAAEAAGSINVTGTVGGDAALGDAVTMQINGVAYGGNVIDIGGGVLGYSIAVAGSDLAADTSFDITVSGSDAAGNPFSATITSTHSVDTSASATITVGNVTSDNVINSAEASAGNYVTITGTVGGDAEVGDTVVVTVGGSNFTTTVLSGMTFAVDVPGSLLAANSQVTATLSGSDAAGNPFNAVDTQSYTVDVSAPTLSAQSFNYAENQTANAMVATVVATDSSGVAGFRFAATGTGTSADGFYTIDNAGNVRITAAGVAAGVANNDFEVGGNSFVYAVQAVDTYGNASTAQNITLNVTNLNDTAPQLDLDGNNSSGISGSGYQANYIEGGSPVRIADADITITDVDSSSLVSATIRITNAEAGDLLSVGSLPAGITASAYNPTTGTITLSGVASLADYQTAIRAIQFINNGSASGAARNITVEVNDGANISNVATTTITMTQVPTVSISDVSVQEPASGTVTMTFTVTVDTAPSSNLTFNYQTVNGSATAGVDYVGVTSTVGTILAGQTSTTITVTVNSDNNVFEGDENFFVNLTGFNQLVNFAPGSHLISGGVRAIGEIGANNGAPVAADDSYVGQPDTALVTGNVLINDTLVDNATITGFSATSTNGGNVVYNGDGTFTYTPVNGFVGTDTFTYTLTDADGETDTATVTIQVTSASVQAPTVTGVNDLQYTENQSAMALLPAIQIADADSSNLNSVVVTLSGYIPSQDVLNLQTAGTSINAVITTNGNTWQLTLSGGADINEYLTVLQSLTYQNSSDNPSAATRSVTVAAYDQDFANIFSSDSAVLNVTPVNDAPQTFANNVYALGSADNVAMNIAMPFDADHDLNDLVITVTGLPSAIGSVMLADGVTPVTVGQTLTAAQLSSLVFDAGASDGTAQFTYTVSDGEFTTAGATTINVGATDPDTATVYESGLAGGTQLPDQPAVATGNLFANDAAANGPVTNIVYNGTTYNAVAGVITINTAHGTLTVNAATGDYSYQLNQANNSGNDVSEQFTYSFNNGSTFSDTLTVNIIDDTPVAAPVVQTIPESEEQTFNLVFTLDISTSMAATVGSTGETRLQLAKDALIRLGEEYFNQSGNVTLTVVLFADGAHRLGTYTDFASFSAAVSGVVYAGGNNYRNDLLTSNGGPGDPQGDTNAFVNDGTSYVDPAALIRAILAQQIAGQNPASNVQNISYFLSDGAITRDTEINLRDSGFRDYMNSNGVASYSVGIGTGLPSDLSDLNYMHNVDQLGRGSGQIDQALIVSDVSLLETELLSTVPTAFGGNLTQEGTITRIDFGADGGYVQSIVLAGIGTISYDGSTITVPPGIAATVEINGSRITLNGNDGFSYGTFVFDFATGNYLFTAPNGTAPATFNFDYTVIDGDGDVASSTATFAIVDDVPEARDDLHTIRHNEVATGNVITGIGTDGGPSLGADFTPFAVQGGGVDKVVDNATVSAFEFRGLTINLDATPLASGVADSRTLTSATSLQNAQFTVSGIRALHFNGSGIGMAGGGDNNLNVGEELRFDFDGVRLPYGVNNLSLSLGGFNSGESVLVRVFDAAGNQIAAFTHSYTGASSNSINLSSYQGVGAVEIEGNGGSMRVNGISYQPTQPSVVSNGGSEGSLSYTYSAERDQDGNLIVRATVTDSSDGTVFTMGSNGYYSFASNAALNPPATVNISTSSAAAVAASAITLVASEGVVGYGSRGAIVDRSGDFSDGAGEALEAGESLTINFSSTALPHGANNVVLSLGSYSVGEAVYVTVVDRFGTVIINNQLFDSATINLSAYDYIRSVTITAAPTNAGAGDLGINTSTFVGLTGVSYQPAVNNPGVTPEAVNYWLTDHDGQSDAAQLAIYPIDRHLNGSDGVDNILGSNLNDAIVAGAGNDIVSGGAGHDTISGGSGDDTLHGNDGRDYLSGGAGRDQLFGGDDDDHLAGDEGDDLLDGGTGDDILMGGVGDDDLFGGAGNDLLEGGVGNDELYGGAGNDTLRGQDGDDRLFGGGGSDVLHGGRDQDLLQGGAGDDILTGGAGADTFVWTLANAGTPGAAANDTITDFSAAEGDVLDLAALLQGENSGNIDSYLNFVSDGNGGTIIQVWTDGDQSHAYDQTIHLQGVDLTAAGSLSDADIIAQMIANGSLRVDGGP